MVLVTGSTGFLGKRVCEKLGILNKDFYKTSLSSGVDLRDRDQTLALFKALKPEYVINCAAYVGGIQFGLKHSGEIFINNTLIISNLLEACRIYHVKRLVNPISNCAYPGDASIYREDQFWNGPVHHSVFIYGMTRRHLITGTMAYHDQYNLDSINVTLPNMYGPEDHFEEERSHALGALIMKIVEAKNNGSDGVSVWGTGNPVREWLHIDDGAEIMIRALDVTPYKGIINIGVGKGISIRDMAYLIKDIAGYNGDLIFDDSKEDGAPYKTMDASFGYEFFNWKPGKAFKNGVEETIRWYEAYRRKLD